MFKLDASFIIHVQCWISAMSARAGGGECGRKDSTSDGQGSYQTLLHTYQTTSGNWGSFRLQKLE